MTGRAGTAAAWSEISRLRGARPRSRFLRLSLWGFFAFAVYAWLSAGLLTTELFAPQRRENLRRFFGEMWPYPLRGRGFDLPGLADWARDLLLERGLAAAGTTLAISVVAICLAGLFGAAASLAAARTFATAEPYLPAPRPAGAWRRGLWRAVAAGTRVLLVFLRSIPEYFWAFLLIALLGPSTWVAILALAMHNTGILGKLDAEVIENLDASPMRALRSIGASRLQLASTAVAPLVTPRLLLFFFYRWETCVREATVIGLLGITSLGFFIQDARARQQVDVMVFFVLLGACLVLLGDLLSALARGFVRKA